MYIIVYTIYMHRKKYVYTVYIYTTIYIHGSTYVLTGYCRAKPKIFLVGGHRDHFFLVSHCKIIIMVITIIIYICCTVTLDLYVFCYV